jgi:hypothetical protein
MIACPVTTESGMPVRDAQTSRRSLFGRVATAVAGFVAFLFVGSRAAHAEGEAMAVGETYNDATSTTAVSTTAGFGLSGASSDPNGAGVYGESSAGPGVIGFSTSTNSAGVGVFGSSPRGTGVQATSTSGIALSVTGRVRFSRSGLATIATGASSVKVALSGVTSSSMVLATLQSSNNSNSVAGVAPTSGSFTIYLNTAALESMRIAWFVIN